VTPCCLSCERRLTDPLPSPSKPSVTACTAPFFPTCWSYPQLFLQTKATIWTTESSNTIKKYITHSSVIPKGQAGTNVGGLEGQREVVIDKHTLRWCAVCVLDLVVTLFWWRALLVWTQSTVECSAKRICTRYKPVLCRPIQWVRHLQQPSGTQDQGACQNPTFPSKPRNKNENKVFVELEKSISSCGMFVIKTDTNSWGQTYRQSRNNTKTSQI